MNKQLDSEIKSRLISIFRDETSCDEWLGNSKKSLGGISPLEALKREDGKNKVIEIIIRIETGDFS